MGLAKGPMKKGGNRNIKKDAIDLEHLVDLWGEIAKTNDCIFSNFGEYKHIWGECAPRPDLVNFIDLSTCLQRVSPTLNVGYSDLKEAVSMILSRQPHLKPKPQQPLAEVSGHIADKLLVVQKHLRSLAWNNGWEERLDKFIGKLQPGKADKFNGFIQQLQKHHQIATPKKKALKVAKSDVSTPAKDEYGLPKIPALSQASEDGDDLLPGEATTPLPSRKAEIKRMKKPVCSPQKRPAAHHKGLAEKAALYFTRGTKQSYITALEPGSHKKKLWVAISKKQSLNHQALVQKIYKAKPCSKEKALAMREEALASF